MPRRLVLGIAWTTIALVFFVGGWQLVSRGAELGWVLSGHRPGNRPNSKERRAALELTRLQRALQQYVRDNGRAPTTEQGLESLIAQPKTPPWALKWQPYLPDLNEVPRDPWGYEYHYRCLDADGQAFEVVSYGADGRPGGIGEAADLRGW